MHSNYLKLYNHYVKFLVWATHQNDAFPDLTKRMLKNIKHVM